MIRELFQHLIMLILIIIMTATALILTLGVSIAIHHLLSNLVFALGGGMLG